MAKAYPVTLNQVFRLWLPLAGSWVLMSIESPMLTAFVARMVSPEITLAAWGSLVYPTVSYTHLTLPTTPYV